MLQATIVNIFRERVRVLCDGIEAVLGASSSRSVDAAQSWWADGWGGTEAADVSRTTRVLLEIELLRLHWAAGRLEAGSYGRCFRCGGSLTVERLHVDPASTFCAECLQLLACVSAPTGSTGADKN